MKTKGYAIYKKGEELKPFEYDLEPKENEVLVKVTHCGVCYTDIHMIDDDWEMTEFPFVPGHEIVGQVVEIGKKVTKFKVGDRVGIGWQNGSCKNCEWCERKEQNLCQSPESIIIGNHGGFSDHAVCNEDFVISIPENLDSAIVAPLLCAGITVYNPLIEFNVRPEMKVGVVGVGGLGHIAVQFMKAYGCEVTVFSSSDSKKDLAKKLGADHFILVKTKKDLEEHFCTLDFILVTAHADLDWDTYAKVLRPKGNMCFVGIPEKEISVSVDTLLNGQRSISANPSGPPNRIFEMLKFAGRNNIKPMIEVFPLEKVNEAVKRVKENKIRFRAVLEI